MIGLAGEYTKRKKLLGRGRKGLINLLCELINTVRYKAGIIGKYYFIN
jgi:hypothetical protein